MHQHSFTGSAKSHLRMKAVLAIYSHVVDISVQCMSVSLILGFKLDFSSCANWDGFRKSIHIYIILLVMND